MDTVFELLCICHESESKMYYGWIIGWTDGQTNGQIGTVDRYGRWIH